jgi:hypothetical protein
LIVPQGSIRIATGTYSGTAPGIETSSVNTKASVWKLNHPAGETELATLEFRVPSLAPCSSAFVLLTSTPQATNVAAGGAIAVSGSNNNYASEINQLLEPSVNKGSAPIQTIGDESGNVYVMAKLVGTAADIAAVLADTNQDVDASDPEFAALHGAYDSQFGGGGFNALFKFPNVAGPKVFNWDFSASIAPNVTVDQLAVVPEPSVFALAAMAGIVLSKRKR